MPRALLSVSDKTGIVEFALGLEGFGFELISTGGTARALREAGLEIRDVSEVTGFPEMLDGRVKTLHPFVHAGLLADLRNSAHRSALAKLGIEPISLLCVNLYAFESTVTREHRFVEAVESIDIGGPAMIRSAAKNHANVLVVVDPTDYPKVLDALRTEALDEFRLAFASKAFRHTAFYDSLVARYLMQKAGIEFPETLTFGMRKAPETLRYGENPHQSAARYLDPLAPGAALRPFSSAGKEISYNNWLDAQAAWDLACDLAVRSCVIVKHGNPCGAATGSTLGESFRMAKASDPVSSFGGIVAFRGVIDQDAVDAMAEKGNFLEVVVSSSWESESLVERFRQGSAWTQNVRFLLGDSSPKGSGIEIRSILGGFLVQESDRDPGEADWKVVSKLEPTEDQWAALRFQWTVAKHVKSNAIAVGTRNRLLGVGAGQMNRVQSVRLALDQAGSGAKGAALASDAFFPFPDGIHAASEAGIGAVIQPGGSKKDAEVIEAANETGLAMVFTGTRHFRH